MSSLKKRRMIGKEEVVDAEFDLPYDQNDCPVVEPKFVVSLQDIFHLHYLHVHWHFTVLRPSARTRFPVIARTS